MEAASEDPVFLAAHDSYVDTLSDLGDDILIKGGADIAVRMETQRMADFLETLESPGETDGTFISQFETAVGSEFVCGHVCDDVAFAMSEELGLTAVENTTIGHISDVEEPPLRVSDVKHKARKDLW